jgi:hypothetical protein
MMAGISHSPARLTCVWGHVCVRFASWGVVHAQAQLLHHTHQPSPAHATPLPHQVVRALVLLAPQHQPSLCAHGHKLCGGGCTPMIQAPHE